MKDHIPGASAAPRELENLFRSDPAAFEAALKACIRRTPRLGSSRRLERTALLRLRPARGAALAGTAHRPGGPRRFGWNAHLGAPIRHQLRRGDVYRPQPCRHHCRSSHHLLLNCTGVSTFDDSRARGGLSRNAPFPELAPTRVRWSRACLSSGRFRSSSAFLELERGFVHILEEERPFRPGYSLLHKRVNKPSNQCSTLYTGAFHGEHDL